MSESDSIKLACEHCGAKLRVSSDRLFEELPCPKCKKPVYVEVPEMENEPEAEDYLPPPPIRKKKSAKKKPPAKEQNLKLVWMIGISVVSIFLVVAIGFAVSKFVPILTDTIAQGVENQDAQEKSEFAGEQETEDIKVRREIFEPIYRVCTSIKAGQKIGINREKFGELLQEFATELIIASDKAESSQEKEICSAYEDLLSIYRDAGRVWDVKISVPRLKYEGKQTCEGIYKGDIKMLGQFFEYERSMYEGIQLTSFPRKVPNGLAILAKYYSIPISEQKGGWKTIPQDSVPRIWEKAREKQDEVDALRKQ